MKTLVNNLERLDLFKHYNNKTNPFVMVTTRVDITNIYNKCKHYYASIAYYLNCAIDKVDNFKYRYEDGNIYYYDKVNINFTQKYKDRDDIGFFTVPYKDTYEEFINEYLKIQEDFNLNHTCVYNNDQGEVWYSFVPWFNFSGLIPPYDRDITIPQFIWDKFIIDDGKCYIDLMIMGHHGFIDGYHIGKVLENFNEIVSGL